MCRSFHRGVAEPAVDAEAGDVMLMAERHRLIDRPADTSRVVHTRPQPPPGDSSTKQAREPNQHQFRDKVGAGTEDRCHAAPLNLSPNRAVAAVNSEAGSGFLSGLLILYQIVRAIVDG